MPNTYTQIYIHIIFAVYLRQPLIRDEFRETLHKYISGTVNKKGSLLIRVNSMPDHIHILVALNPEKRLSDLVRDIKANSSKFINEEKFIGNRFQWQRGYSAFSYSKSQLKGVIDYIDKQKGHHRKRTFKEEYIEFLKKFGVDYDDRYLFDKDD